MTPIAQVDTDFAFIGADPSTIAQPPVVAAAADVQAQVAQAADPLGPLAILPGPGTTPGTWVGHGFNTIWRPHRASTGQDRFLELNLTDEKIVFSRIPGDIPNRGLAMGDINMHGVTYMQQINEAGHPAQGLHIEPGIWAHVPQTSDPAEPQTVVRMASIPHGTVINAQGIFQTIQGGPPVIPDNNILPFFFGSPAPHNTDFNNVALTFPELELAVNTPFRQLSPGVTQDMVKNPNSVLQKALQTSLQGTTMRNRTFIHISTTNNPINGGGGTANTVFLDKSGNPPGGNANATQMTATFWLQTIAGTGGHPDIHQLQYTQLVMLDFNGIHWPHVTVGTLVKQ
jgi:hypothetical protein